MLKGKVLTEVRKSGCCMVNHFSGSQFLYLYNGHRKPPPCIGYFSHYNDRTLGKSDLREEGFISAHGSRE